MVINYQQLGKLLVAPPQARAAKKRRTKNIQTAKHGKPDVNWDYIIFDEAHYLKRYPESTVSLMAASIAQLNNPYVKGKTPFVIFSTATPGSTPLNLSVMSGIIAPGISKAGKDVGPNDWPKFLSDQGFHITKSKNGTYGWVSEPWGKPGRDEPEKLAKYESLMRSVKAKQRRDSRRIGKSLIRPEAPFIKRSPKDIAGWPEQQMVPYPVELTVKQLPLYKEAWTRFRDWLRMPGSANDPKGALVENLRYRQKSSLLKVEQNLDLVFDLLESGNQVYISCEFLDTVDAFKTALIKKKIPVAEISGRTEKNRTEERLNFQTGRAKVVLCTVVEGISLHSGETLPDGSTASSAPRATIVHDVRQNDLDTDQLLGRAHRDGTNSIAYFPFFENTVDEKVINRYVNKRSNRKTMLGEDSSTAEKLENLFLKIAMRDS